MLADAASAPVGAASALSSGQDRSPVAGSVLRQRSSVGGRVLRRREWGGGAIPSATTIIMLHSGAQIVLNVTPKKISKEQTI
jgi:hypothetical protein